MQLLIKELTRQVYALGTEAGFLVFVGHRLWWQGATGLQ
jgi:hypothetical protein